MHRSPSDRMRGGVRCERLGPAQRGGPLSGPDRRLNTRDVRVVVGNFPGSSIPSGAEKKASRRIGSDCFRIFTASWRLIARAISDSPVLFCYSIIEHLWQNNTPSGGADAPASPRREPVSIDPGITDWGPLPKPCSVLTQRFLALVAELAEFPSLESVGRDVIDRPLGHFSKPFPCRAWPQQRARLACAAAGD